MQNVLKNLTIKTKTYAGFGLVLGLMALLGGSALFGLTRAEKDFVQYRNLARQTAELGQIQGDLLVVTSAVREYAESGDNSAADAAAQAFLAIEGNRDDLNDLIKTAANRESLNAITGQISDYQRVFEAIKAAATGQRPAIVENRLDAVETQLVEAVGDLRAKAKAEQDRVGPELQSAFRTTVRNAVVIAVVSAVIAIAAALIIGNAISAPVIRLTRSMRAMADGQLETQIPAQDHADEIGAMAKALGVFRDGMVENQRMVEAQKRDAEAKASRAEQIQALTAAFDREVSGVLDTVSAAATELESTANNLTALATQSNQQAATVAAASEEASSNVETVASAANQLTSSVGEISQQVGKSSNIAAEAVREAQASDEKVTTLAKAAQEIGDVVNIITDIAAQTNLLALNATIEAARAGEAGKGFAVVANEVKSLASQTQKATEEIGGQITGIQNQTQDAVSAIRRIVGSIEQMNEISGAIAAAMDEQNAATNEIARNVEEAAAGTRDVSENIAGVTEASSQTGAASEQVLSASGELAAKAEGLRAAVQNFLADMREDRAA